MKAISIEDKKVGVGFPVYIVAELSGNHNHEFDRAVQLIDAAKDAGADAIKLQTYTPDTITLDCDSNLFGENGELSQGKSLYQVYQQAYMPWEWQPKLKKIANKKGLACFSSPFDPTSVDFLESMNVPIYKVASSEICDLPLLKKIAKTNKPIILSTGMATLREIDEALSTINGEGNDKVILLKCTSAYPASPSDINLKTMGHMSSVFNTPVGLSDHTLGHDVASAATSLGACMIEKHLTLCRNDGGIDDSFSMEPGEFKDMVRSIRIIERSIGRISYGPTRSEKIGVKNRRSLFIVNDIKKGDLISNKNVRSIRPGHGLKPKHIDKVIGKRARKDLLKGTPLQWELIK
jgi:pseudaminic acid synthase